MTPPEARPSQVRSSRRSPRPSAAVFAVGLLTACLSRPFSEPALGRAPDPVSVRAELGYLRERTLLIPVVGVHPDALRNTYDDPRSGGRIHQAIDILAPMGTPVRAADNGYVLRVGENTLGGKVIFLSDPARRLVYYYAHLDTQNPGLRVGQPISRGDRIGTVGHTGNATADAPHLHFQVMVMGPTPRWWDGQPLNPFPTLRRAVTDR